MNLKSSKNNHQLLEVGKVKFLSVHSKLLQRLQILQKIASMKDFGDLLKKENQVKIETMLKKMQICRLISTTEKTLTKGYFSIFKIKETNFLTFVTQKNVKMMKRFGELKSNTNGILLKRLKNLNLLCPMTFSISAL